MNDYSMNNVLDDFDNLHQELRALFSPLIRDFLVG